MHVCVQLPNYKNLLYQKPGAFNVKNIPRKNLKILLR